MGVTITAQVVGSQSIQRDQEEVCPLFFRAFSTDNRLRQGQEGLNRLLIPMVICLEALKYQFSISGIVIRQGN